MAQTTPIEPELIERSHLPVPARTNELVLTEGEAAALQKVQARVLVAKKWPRNEDACFQAIVRSCDRFRFAETVEYRFKRGFKPDGSPNIVQGPSVYLAREMARIWGNMDHGFEIISEDENNVTLRGRCWDLQTNAEVYQDNTFRKVHLRRVDGGKAKPVPITDDRDLRELKNRQGALAERNCMLALFPEDLKRDAIDRARETVTKKIMEDPEGHRKKILAGFLQVNVSAEQLEKYLGCKVVAAAPAQLTDLRGMWSAIADGVAVWTDFVPAEIPQGGEEGKKPAPKTREGMKDKLRKANAASDKKGKQKEEPPKQSTDDKNKPAEGATPPEPVPTPEDGDPASEGQKAIIKAMYETTIGLAEAGAVKLKEWNVVDPAELSYGGARDFITFLEAASKGGN